MDNKSSFDRFMDAMQKTGDITLRYYYQKQMIKDALLSAEERKKLIDEVADQVISRISLTVDVTDIINSIEEIRKKLDELFK